LSNLVKSHYTGMDLDHLQSIGNDILIEAKRQGADSAETGISVDGGLSITARLGDVETIEHHRSQGVGVTVYFGRSKGSSSTTDLTPSAIVETVKAACWIAKFSADDEYNGLPDKTLLVTNFPDLDLYHPWELSADQAIDLAIKCENVAREFHPDINNSEGASVTTHHGVQVLANSLGFNHGYPVSRHSISCCVLGQRGKSMQRDYWYTVARDRTEMETSEAVGQKAAERTLKRLNGCSLSTRQCPVLFAPEVAAGLLGHFIGAVKGTSLYRKSSFLLDSLGKQIFPPHIHIHEQPHLKKALGSVPYDGEGVATKNRDIVKDGKLESYVLSTYSARKLSMQSTGNAGGVHNLTIDTGKLDQTDLMRQMGRGLLVTEVMGQGVNLVTGDYSRGASGFWIENGEIQYPVEEITIAGNLQDIFKNIVAVGRDIDFRGNIRTGSILVEEMTVAGSADGG